MMKELVGNLSAQLGSSDNSCLAYCGTDSKTVGGRIFISTRHCRVGGDDYSLLNANVIKKNSEGISKLTDNQRDEQIVISKFTSYLLVTGYRNM